MTVRPFIEKTEQQGDQKGLVRAPTSCSASGPSTADVFCNSRKLRVSLLGFGNFK